jgi:molybdate transport system ATP-binding protein
MKGLDMHEVKRGTAVRIRIKNAAAPNGLKVENFCVSADEAWCILSPNRCGGEEFFDLLSAASSGNDAQDFYLTPDIEVLSFATQQKIFEDELAQDDSDFLECIDPGTPARAFIPEADKHRDLIASFGLTSHLEQGYRELSTGQARRLLLIAACVRCPECLLLEAPYEGLDSRGREELDRCLLEVWKQGCCLILFCSNSADVPAWVSHVALLGDRHIRWQGRRADLTPTLLRSLSHHDADFSPEAPPQRVDGSDPDAAAPLVELKAGHAGYRGKDVFRNLDLTIRRGEHTLVSGSNGSGKSTLLQLICGDHPACYQNELQLFGIRRGSGESIWELKRHMGIVSPDLHRNYNIDTDLFSCILSGLFDSIGVYRKAGLEEKKAAHRWLEWTGLLVQKNRPFRSLSYADQRLALIARALIKNPPLLILDEPTQGLDDANRYAVLDFIEKIGCAGISTILYVSHRRDEYREFFTQHLIMDQYRVGGEN